MALTRPQNCAKLGLGGIWGRARVPRYGSRALFLIRNQSTSSDKAKSTKNFKEKLRFFDRAFLRFRAGKGGDGHKSFISDRFGNKLADGERGGDGGNIVLRACKKIMNLRFDSYHIIGSNGENGGSNHKRGRKANDTTILVPVGTVAKTVERCLITKQRKIHQVLADLDEDGATFVAAQGGEGGLGNTSFRRGFRRRPDFRVDGHPGEQIEVFLELKSLADVGLVGFPNAGKSSLLRRLSKAKPKVASYPFTTLQPHIGYVEANDIAMTQFTVADIPGLIEGASQGKGLGHHFLRHIERTKAIMFVLDGAGSDGRDPLVDLEMLTTELYRYSEKFHDIPALVFLNKSDLSDEYRENEDRIRAMSPFDVVCGSAQQWIGEVDNIIPSLHNLLKKADPIAFPDFDARFSALNQLNSFDDQSSNERGREQESEQEREQESERGREQESEQERMRANRQRMRLRRRTRGRVPK